MKKIIIGLSIFASTLLFADCQKLNLQKGDINTKKDFIQSLSLSLPTIKKIYFDLIKEYNKLDSEAEVVNYVSSESLKNLSSTAVWGSLTYLTYNEPEKYNNFLKSIDFTKIDWCKKTYNINNLKIIPSDK
ncbi:hypothetical protein CP985_03305 [Malaciobacter mytili LMG 24559]|uniref:Lipoprotein n=1 Tax=Malaciobacter mytili LMG 24559 TaxID=1032238 RepID=A0AAX2AL51_9BACT|nr:hypothetical protein [Malaciobacter mytili]AXH16385.1 hypothetical protein AMYT_a0086 [Malaciobacter mytili LMG 24559]RXK16451.1 hypothetical protein CP985_03305 [Malaciobacter mytili LMG 24559]